MAPAFALWVGSESIAPRHLAVPEMLAQTTGSARISSACVKRLGRAPFATKRSAPTIALAMGAA